MQSDVAMQSTERPGIGGFLAWGAAGTGLLLGLLTILTIGPYVILLDVLFIAGLLVARRTRNASAVGVLAGFGIPPLYVAYLNRSGPGDVCTQFTASGNCTSSTTEWSPWPWLAAGALLIGVSLLAFIWVRRASAPQRISGM